MSASTEERPGTAPARGAVTLGAAALYLAATLTLSYAVWGPYDGVEHDPGWASDDRLWPALIVLHIVAGAGIGRWWALALPVAWAVLSAPAGGYDTPVWIGIAFNLPLWLPAVAAGVLVRRVWPSPRGPLSAGRRTSSGPTSSGSPRRRSTKAVR